MTTMNDLKYASAAGTQGGQGEARAESMLEWLRDYAARRINSALMDARRSIPPYVVLDLGNHGFFGLQVSTAWGGAGLSNQGSVRILEQLGAIDLTLATLVVVQNFLGIRPILQHGTAALHEELMGKLASGRELVAFGLTEPVAGSNPSAIQGSAVLQPNGRVRLDGTKIWIGNASWASVINVFLRYRDAAGQARGICGYVVRQDAKGLEMGPELLTMGMRGMVQNMFKLDGVEVDVASQLGAIGQGMDVAHDAMMYTRLALGATFVGAMKRCLQLMTRYAERRTAMATGRLLDNPVSLMRIGQHAAQARAMQNLLSAIAQRLDEQAPVPEEFLVVCKVSGSEFLWETADSAMQMLGGRGYLENNEVARIMRDARVGRIFEGPSETMWHYLGARLLRDGQGLIDFLCTQFDGADIARQLQDTAEQVRMRCQALSAPFQGRQRADLASAALGQAVCSAILYAVCRHAARDGDGENARCAHWAEGSFGASLRALTGPSVAEQVMPTPQLALELVQGYARDIGDIEQGGVGEALLLDPYLQRRTRACYSDLM